MKKNRMHTSTLKLAFLVLTGLAGILPAWPGFGQQPVQLPAPLSGATAPPIPFHPVGELRVQIRDITSIEGHRSNQLMGVGLVIGLAGTGGRSPATLRLTENLLKRNDIVGTQITSKSSSMVFVTAELPPFARVGEPIDITVSVADDAKDLKGGTLLLTPLKGVDDQVYAIAQGALVSGGFAVSGEAASVQKNHPTSANATAIVEKTVCMDSCLKQDYVTLLLLNKDYLTSSRIAAAINNVMPNHARSLDRGAVEVRVPESFRNTPNDFIATIGGLSIVPNMPARVVINQKTGTIVMSSSVRLSRVVFANDNLIVTTAENPAVSQPAPFSEGATTVVPRTQITAVEQGGRFNLLSEGIEVGEFAAALNAMGVSPQDLITIFKSIHASGALHAELVIE